MKALLPSIALLLCACGRDVTPPPAAPLPEVGQLCQRIDRLVEVLERAAIATSAAERPGAGPPARSAADETVAGLKQRVAQLEGELDILRMQTALAAGTLAAAPRPARIEPLQRDPVKRLMKGVHSDNPKANNETLAELLLMGPAQVLQLLGMPTSTSLLQQGVSWGYVIDDESLDVVFVNGQVMQVY